MACCGEYWGYQLLEPLSSGVSPVAPHDILAGRCRPRAQSGPPVRSSSERPQARAWCPSVNPIPPFGLAGGTSGIEQLHHEIARAG
jgi:hypothetical protein